MAKIKVIPSEVALLGQSIAQGAAVPIDGINQMVYQVLTELDMKVATTEGIRTELSEIRKKCTIQEDRFKRISNITNLVANDFAKVDRQLTNQMNELNGLMDYASLQAIDGVRNPGILGLLSTVGIDELFGISYEGYQDIRSAMGMIRSFLDSEAARVGRVSADGEALYQYLLENDPNLVFGQYNYVAHFLNDVKGIDVLSYGLLNWDKAGWCILFGGSMEGIAEAFLNDPDACKAILREVIDDICGTDYLDVFSSDQEEALNIISDLAELGGFSGTSEFIDALTEAAGDAETADKILKDYSANIAMLESLKEIAPNSGMLTEIVDDLLVEYKNQAAAMLFEDVDGKIQEGIIHLTDLAFGTSFGIADTVIEAVLGDVESLDSLDTVIFSTEIRGNAIQAFRNASQKIMSGNFTSEDLTAYQNSFSLAKALTIEQYEAMYSYYDSDSIEAQYLKSQLDQLEAMECNDFHYAQSFDSYKESHNKFSSGSGFGGGGGGGGFG